MNVLRRFVQKWRRSMGKLRRRTSVTSWEGDPVVGNVHGKFGREADAENAVTDLNNRWFDGQPSHAEPSPQTDFRAACRRQDETGECSRGGSCGFVHLKPISRELRRELYGRRRKKRRSRCRSRQRRSGSRDRGRGGGGGPGRGGGSVTGGSREGVKDLGDSEPSHFYLMSARKCCS
uniref:C3H1-type domain-containing protein n=1 Tax=Macaca fascicularis TaxID=9541 RepID=A0A7N9DC47_MACFA